MGPEDSTCDSSKWRRVHTLAVLLGVALTILGVCVMIRQASRGASAGLISDQILHSFGDITVAHARELEHTFVLTNTGNPPVRITAVKTSCGCTSAAVRGTVVLPHSSIQVPVKPDWTGKAGFVQEWVTLETDSRATPRLSLGLGGDVKVPVAV